MPAKRLGPGGALYLALTAGQLVFGLLLDSWFLIVVGASALLLGLAVWGYRTLARVGVLRPLFIRRTVRPTRVGGLYLLLVIVMALAAVNTGLNMLYLVFAMLLAVLLLSGLLSENALRGLRVTVTVPPAAVAGEPVVLGVHVENRKRLTASWALRVEPPPAPGCDVLSGGYAPCVRPRRTVECRVRVRPHRRGRVSLPIIRVSTGFPFGFVRHAWWHPVAAELAVWPRVGRCARLPSPPAAGAAAEVSRGRNPGDDDFHALRDYRPGDNPRRIHWRSTARARRLMVREHRAARRGVAVILAVGEAPDPAALDDVADITATLAAALARDAWEVHVGLAGAERGQYRQIGDARGPDALRRLLVDWSGGGSDTALRAIPAAALRGAMVLVAAPGLAVAEPLCAQAREAGAAGAEAWVPPDVWVRGWVDFGTQSPKRKPATGYAYP